MWLPTVERNLLSVATESSGTFALLIVHRDRVQAIAQASPHLSRRSVEDQALSNRERPARPLVFTLHSSTAMLKLIGSYALAKLLGFGLVGAIVIYALLSLLS